jgi:sugar O-acyltransferase (sialic acid O-acetyltransferase NeuD family)
MTNFLMPTQVSYAQSRKIVFGLVGAGGFGRDVMPIVRELFLSNQQSYVNDSVDIYFVETNPTHQRVNSVDVISEADFVAMNCDEKFFNIAVANSKIRQEIAERLMLAGAQPLTLQSLNTVVYNESTVAEGAIICQYSTITSNSKIGKFFHSNLYSYVGHDCIIGNYVTFGARVCCNGNVHIHDHAYLGTTAMIKQGTPGKPLIIGEGAIIGMGAVVTKDVPPYTTVIGNPARPLI